MTILFHSSLPTSQAYTEKEAAKGLKNKQRERMQPKMGRMDIDYQVGRGMGCKGGLGLL